MGRLNTLWVEAPQRQPENEGGKRPSPPPAEHPGLGSHRGCLGGGGPGHSEHRGGAAPGGEELVTELTSSGGGKGGGRTDSRTQVLTAGPLQTGAPSSSPSHAGESPAARLTHPAGQHSPLARLPYQEEQRAHTV